MRNVILLPVAEPAAESVEELVEEERLDLLLVQGLILASSSIGSADETGLPESKGLV